MQFTLRQLMKFVAIAGAIMGLLIAMRHVPMHPPDDCYDHGFPVRFLSLRGGMGDVTAIEFDGMNCIVDVVAISLVCFGMRTLWQRWRQSSEPTDELQNPPHME